MATLRQKSEDLKSLLKQAGLLKAAEETITEIKDPAAGQTTDVGNTAVGEGLGASGLSSEKDNTTTAPAPQDVSPVKPLEIDEPVTGIAVEKAASLLKGIKQKYAQAKAVKPAAPVAKKASPDASVCSRLEKAASLINAKRAAQPVQKQAAATSAQPEQLSARILQQKLASAKDEAGTRDAFSYFKKLAGTEVFSHFLVQAGLKKRAADEQALIEQGAAPEEAAAALDEVVADPEVQAATEQEIAADAVDNMADAEGKADELLAAGQALGLSEEDIAAIPAEDLSSAQQIVEEAAAQGIPPEAVIEAVMADMQEQGQGEEVSPEDEAAAQQILDAAAAEGMSEEDVLAAAAELAGQGQEPSVTA